MAKARRHQTSAAERATAPFSIRKEPFYPMTRLSHSISYRGWTFSHLDISSRKKKRSCKSSDLFPRSNFSKPASSKLLSNVHPIARPTLLVPGSVLLHTPARARSPDCRYPRRVRLRLEASLLLQVPIVFLPLLFGLVPCLRLWLFMLFLAPYPFAVLC